MRIVRKGINPVKLPFALKTNHPILASWANEVRTSIQQLRDRIPTVGGGFSGVGGGTAPHPFQLQVTGNSLRVGFGCMDIARILLDEDAKPFMCMERAAVAVGTGGLNGGPDDDVGGTLTLTTGVLYGIWFEFLWSLSGAFDKTAGISGQFVNWNSYGFSLGVDVIASSTFTTPAATSIMADNSTKSYLFIGTAQTDGTTGTVKQHIRSDIQMPLFALPNTIISSDSDPELQQGSDGGISYEA